MAPASTMDNGKVAWDTCSTDHGNFLLVHVAKHIKVGTYHGWHLDVYSMTMVPTDLCLLYAMCACDVTMSCAWEPLKKQLEVLVEPIAWHHPVPCVPWALQWPHGIAASQTMGVYPSVTPGCL
jgi:hypothetical protein